MVGHVHGGSDKTARFYTKYRNKVEQKQLLCDESILLNKIFDKVVMPCWIVNSQIYVNY